MDSYVAYPRSRYDTEEMFSGGAGGGVGRGRGVSEGDGEGRTRGTKSPRANGEGFGVVRGLRSSGWVGYGVAAGFVAG